jgi:hypothetical protein
MFTQRPPVALEQFVEQLSATRINSALNTASTADNIQPMVACQRSQPGLGGASRSREVNIGLLFLFRMSPAVPSGGRGATLEYFQPQRGCGHSVLRSLLCTTRRHPVHFWRNHDSSGMTAQNISEGFLMSPGLHQKHEVGGFAVAIACIGSSEIPRHCAWPIATPWA